MKGVTVVLHKVQRVVMMPWRKDINQIINQNPLVMLLPTQQTSRHVVMYCIAFLSADQLKRGCTCWQNKQWN